MYRMLWHYIITKYDTNSAERQTHADDYLLPAEAMNGKCRAQTSRKSINNLYHHEPARESRIQEADDAYLKPVAWNQLPADEANATSDYLVPPAAKCRPIPEAASEIQEENGDTMYDNK